MIKKHISTHRLSPSFVTQIRSLSTPTVSVDDENEAIQHIFIQTSHELKTTHNSTISDDYIRDLSDQLTSDQLRLLTRLQPTKLHEFYTTICYLDAQKGIGIPPIEVRRIADAYEMLSYSAYMEEACKWVGQNFINHPLDYKNTFSTLMHHYLSTNEDRMTPLHLTYHRWSHGLDMYRGVIDDNTTTTLTDKNDILARLGALVLVPFIALNHDGYQRLNEIIKSPTSDYTSQHPLKVREWISTHHTNEVQLAGATEEFTAVDTYINYIASLTGVLRNEEHATPTTFNGCITDFFDELNTLSKIATIPATRLINGYLTQEIVGAASLLHILRSEPKEAFSDIPQLSPHRRLIQPSLLKPILTLTLRDITRTVRPATNEAQQSVYKTFLMAYPRHIQDHLNTLFKHTTPSGGFEQFLENSSRMFPELTFTQKEHRQEWYALQQELRPLYLKLYEPTISTDEKNTVITTIESKISQPLPHKTSSGINCSQSALKTMIEWIHTDIAFSLNRNPNDASEAFSTITNDPNSTEWGATLSSNTYHHDLNQNYTCVMETLETAIDPLKNKLTLSFGLHVFRHFCFSEYDSLPHQPKLYGKTIEGVRPGDYHFNKLETFVATYVSDKTDAAAL